MATIQQQFDNASKVVQANIQLLLGREQRGIAKYGCTVDRKDLSLKDWLRHMQEEMLDGINYAEKAIQEQSGENTLNTQQNPPISNAVELAPNALPEIISDLLASLTADQLRETVFTLAKNPNIQFAYFANLVASAEANHYLRQPKEQMPSDVMLRMVGSFDKDQQRDLLQKGMEHATGKKITFVDVTPKSQGN